MAKPEGRASAATAPEISLFILAGEPSGDVIGANLLNDLSRRRKLKPFGVGGAAMLAKGVRSLFPMSDLSVMGYADVLLRLPKLLWRVHQVTLAIFRQQPDIAVFIDAQDFSAMVAKRLRRRGYGGPIVLYVAPSVWAWRPHRAPRLNGIFDEILAVLPFEPRAMRELGGPQTTYVGHPAIRLASDSLKREPGHPGVVALLPGSRRGELKRHLPVFEKVVASLSARHPSLKFVMPTLEPLAGGLKADVANWKAPVEVVTGAGREAAYARADAALASSGTVTLELALRGIPHVGTYVPDRMQMRAYDKAGRPRILLPNIVLGEEIVPEIAPGTDHVNRLLTAMEPLLQAGPQRDAQLEGFARLRQLMASGEPESGIADAADRVQAHLKP